MRFKFEDDLSVLEKLNLVLLGLSSYNFWNHVASDVGINQKFLPSSHIQSQENLNQIQRWTHKKKRKLNVEKSKLMVFNFTNKSQFATSLYLENVLLETITEIKLLAKWNQNTELLVKRSYQRMLILHKLYSFNIADVEMVNI